MLRSTDIKYIKEAVTFYTKQLPKEKKKMYITDRLNEILDELVQFEEDWETWSDNRELNEDLDNEFEKY